MRRRLLFSTLAVALIAVLLLGIPLGVVVGKLVKDEAKQQLQREATTLAAEVDFSMSTGGEVDADRIGRVYPQRYIIIRPPHHKKLVVGTPPTGDELSAEAYGDEGTYVHVAQDDTEVSEDVAKALLLIMTLSLLALGVAVGLAIVYARQMSLPLLDLAESARRLGSGDARPRGHRYGIAELDRVAEVLDQSATRLSDLISAEREFATDASHQLRTPLTALSMRLEEMIEQAEDPDVVREEGAAALTQTERLTRVVDQLLGRARRSRRGHAEPINVDEIIAQQVEEWEPAFRRTGRGLEVTGEAGLQAVATPGGLAQMLATLLDNALMHGGGDVTIRTSATSRSAVVEVSDEGSGVPAELVARVFEREVSGSRSGTGLGLALARGLAEADGGRLELVRARPPVFAVFLRRTPQPAQDDAPPEVSGPA